MVTLACKAWLLSFMQDNLEATVLRKPLEEHPKPSKQRNLVQVIDHSENLHSESVSINGLYVLHLSDGFHFVTAKLTAKSIKRLYKRFPNLKPLSKLRGAIIRLDDYSFNLGGPNRSLCSIIVTKFDYVGAALSGTFRSPSNLSSILSKHYTFQQNQISKLTNHPNPILSPNNIFYIQKKPVAVLTASAATATATVGNSNKNFHSTNNLNQHQPAMNQVQSNFLAPFFNVMGKTNEKNTSTTTPTTPREIFFGQQQQQGETILGVEKTIVTLENNQEQQTSPPPPPLLVQQNNHFNESMTRLKSDHHHQMITTNDDEAPPQPSQNSFFVQNDEEACEIPASQMEQLKNMQIPGFSNEATESTIEIPSNPSTQQLLKLPAELVSGSSINSNSSSGELLSTTTTHNFNHEPSSLNPSSQRNESPNVRRVAATPQRRRTAAHSFLSPDNDHQIVKQPSSSPPHHKFMESSSTPSIIQSQIITSDNDSSDAMEDIPDVIPFSHRSSSVFSPTTRYKNMAPPGVYLHTQQQHTTQKAPSTPQFTSTPTHNHNNHNTTGIITQQQQNTTVTSSISSSSTPMVGVVGETILETPVKDVDELEELLNRRNNRSETEVVDSSEDENENYEVYMSRSLFKNPIHLEEHAIKKLEQRALPHHKRIIQARERRREEEKARALVEAEVDTEITPDTMLEILKDPPIDNRKRQKPEEKVINNSKKQKNNTPPQPQPTTSTTQQQQQQPNTKHHHSITREKKPQPEPQKTNYRSWAEFF